MLKTRVLCFINNYITGHNKFRGHQSRPIWQLFPYRETECGNRRNRISAKTAELRNVRFDIKGCDNIIEFGTTTRMIKGNISVIGNNNRIIIEECCGLYGVTIVMFGDNNTVHIGKNSYFFSDYQGAYIGAGNGANVMIGRDCLFAPDVFIRADDAHNIKDLKTKKIINYAKDIIIDDHVWLGTKCILLKGVQIEHDCVIAAGSLLTEGKYTENAVWGGNPAKMIKENITWEM